MGKPTMWFPNRSDTNQAAQSKKQARSFGFRKKRKCTIRVAKTKVRISFAVTAKLICAIVFAYADCWFSHAAAYMSKGHVTAQVDNKTGCSDLTELND